MKQSSSQPKVWKKTQEEPSFLTDDGRRYFAQATYTLPTDQQEGDRLDIQHALLRQAFGGNYFAPLDQPTSILEVGYGTGRWMAEMATQFSQAQVT